VGSVTWYAAIFEGGGGYFEASKFSWFLRLYLLTFVGGSRGYSLCTESDATNSNSLLHCLMSLSLRELMMYNGRLSTYGRPGDIIKNVRF